jgi:hypothetical protein
VADGFHPEQGKTGHSIFWQRSLKGACCLCLTVFDMERMILQLNVYDILPADEGLNSASSVYQRD